MKEGIRFVKGVMKITDSELAKEVKELILTSAKECKTQADKFKKLLGEGVDVKINISFIEKP